jgi:hypothetical protein
MVRHMSEQMLPDRQTFTVMRIEDNQFIAFYKTMKEAVTAKTEYEDAWNEPCRIGRCFVSGEETVAQRNANEQE